MSNNTEKKYYQWLKGDHAGEVVILADVDVFDDMTFLQFTDGTQCNIDLILPLNEFQVTDNIIMAEISDPNNKWGIETKIIGGAVLVKEQNVETGDIIERPSSNDWDKEGKISIKYHPPKVSSTKKLAEFGITNNKEISKTEQSTITKMDDNIINQNIIIKPQDNNLFISDNKSFVIKPQDNNLNLDLNDPVLILVKNAKKHDTNVNMDLKISLPGKILYDMIKSDFDGGAEKFFEYIIHTIDIKEIKQSLKEAIQLAYEPNEILYNDRREE